MTTMRLNDRIIVITGGTSGIGQCLARTLRNKNNEVIVLGRAGEKLDRMADEGFATVPCDLGQAGSIEDAAHQVAQRWPRVDVLFNNAGVQYNYDLTSEVLPIGRIHREIDIDLSGQVLFTQLMLPLLARSDRAVLVNTTSGLGAYPKTDGLVYSAAKAGMRSFTVGLRNALRGTSIRVLELMPPVTDTGMTAARDEQKMDPQAFVEIALPQLERERKIATTRQLRLFLLIARVAPGLARWILEGKH
ncbi:MAG: SDR family NAD(P)-dependent oxidoreductase [Flavobacteriales bacterium]|nr:SDR family NAD(P)-dependent oxidoreductase [Flavobacteriales bacterium]